MRVEIEKVDIDDVDGLRVRPRNESFPYIYRDASGIRWNAEHFALVASEPSDWEVHELFQQILFAVRNEYGANLYVSHETDFADGLEEQRNTLIELSEDFERRYKELIEAPPLRPSLPA